MNSGRRMDVLIKYYRNRDPGTGVELLVCLSIWADADNTEVINSVEGARVSLVIKENNYLVDVDPRYSELIVAKNIDHALQTRGKLNETNS